ncbi:MAG: Hsp20 family protein [Alphaproteobacteria bacterium]|nr:Hsp20 family protein [Alphaproteobacteria bacterium]
MAHFDFSPFFRSTVGFDRIADLLDDALRASETDGYPPYNIELAGDNAYRITMAVAGMTESDLNVVQHENTLIVGGKARPAPEGAQFLHRGIAGRAFERRFSLADFVKVTGASLANGLLTIDLVREVPEAMKPRTIQIGASQPAAAKVQTIDAKAA